MKTTDLLKIDRNTLTVASQHDRSEDKTYWLSQSPYRRLQAVEILRKINYGDRQSTGRLQRILEIAQRSSG
jgi:hypothetical protein